ncbi:hypothetical protein PIB30_085291 [Stylosanthes scabra]|uniref:Uncharacterized protein n=1 Tax=Stylosanthes scabra TaxID=79078 RepID=A0ABU6ZRF4_9FABA|nr:hypothetical protein [Stylosanthes scabra]
MGWLLGPSDLGAVFCRRFGLSQPSPSSSSCCSESNEHHSSPSTAARALTRRPKLPCQSLAISSRRSVTVGSVRSSTVQIQPRVSFTSPSTCRWINLPPPRLRSCHVSRVQGLTVTLFFLRPTRPPNPLRDPRRLLSADASSPFFQKLPRILTC